MRGWSLNCALFGLSICLSLINSVSGAPFKEETRWIEASTHHLSTWIHEKAESIDRKQIDIEPAYDYVSHSVSIISASPGQSDNGAWSCSDGLVRGEDGRVQAVWVEVRAQNEGLLSSTVYVRARLVVNVRTRMAESEEEILPAPSRGAK